MKGEGVAEKLAPLLASAHVEAFGGNIEYETRAYEAAIRHLLEGADHDKG